MSFKSHVAEIRDVVKYFPFPRIYCTKLSRKDDDTASFGWIHNRWITYGIYQGRYRLGPFPIAKYQIFLKTINSKKYVTFNETSSIFGLHIGSWCICMLLGAGKSATYHFLEEYLFPGWLACTSVTTCNHLRRPRSTLESFFLLFSLLHLSSCCLNLLDSTF